MFATTPKPPYYLVSFTSQRTTSDPEEYDSISNEMVNLAVAQKGYLGHELTRDSSGFGITLSYWEDRISILNWRNQVEHLHAQRLGREKFYQNFITRIAKVEREYLLE